MRNSGCLQLRNGRRQRDKESCIFCRETKGIRRLIIVTNEGERTITKDGLTIEVIPAYKFILGAAF